MQELAWWLVAVLALVCAALAGLLWLRRRAPDAGAAARSEPAPADAREPRALGLTFPAAVAGAGLAPLPAPGAPQRNPVAALVAPPIVRTPALLVAARARRYELRDAAPEPVLVLERGSAEEWRRAAVAAPTPMQCELLSGALAHASLLATAGLRFLPASGKVLVPGSWLPLVVMVQALLQHLKFRFKPTRLQVLPPLRLYKQQMKKQTRVE